MSIINTNISLLGLQRGYYIERVGEKGGKISVFTLGQKVTKVTNYGVANFYRDNYNIPNERELFRH